MDETKLKELEEGIRNASPLDLASKLKEAELYDEKETRAVVDEIYEEFQKKDGLVDEVVIPIFTSIVDGFLESTSTTRKLRKKGLTATRIVNDCRHFSYDNPGDSLAIPNGYDEYKNARDFTIEYGESVRIPYANNRNVYDDGSKDYYKARAVQANGGRKNLVDEYTGERNITAYINNPDGRRTDPKNRYQAQTDHIVPLKKVHEYLKGNYALSDEDIARIANSDDNLALTAARINVGEKGKGGKKDMTNPEFVADQNRREATGKGNLGLSQETKDTMIRKDKEAREAIQSDTNHTVLNNITGNGKADIKLINDRIRAKQDELGRRLTKEEEDLIEKELSRDKQLAIGGELGKNSAVQAKDYLLGNVIMYLIKPLYYEISDIVKNGLQDGVGAESVHEAIKFRFCRVKDYVITNAVHFLGDNVKDFVKAFVSSLIEGIISLFVGIFKQILKVVKEGIRVFIQAGKILFGKQACQMSAAEKGDAIIKLLGGSVITICGIGIEALMNKIGIPDPWSVILSTMLSGIASAMFMLLLDKIDLFSVNAEKRRKRIEEIFEERIKDIQQAEQTFDSSAMETLRCQRLKFASIEKEIGIGIENNNIYAINSGLISLASFFGVNLEYCDLPEFVEQFDDMELSL